jgi:predicted adenine nucleotide alpha hydrolase (AANH) superfamily ATPase
LKILLHACCGPCSIFPVKELTEQGHDLTGYFYNPNIHPYTEFRKRLETFEQYVEKTGLPVIIDSEYELDEFLRGVSFREGDRCRICYGMRLRRAARVAKKGGFDAFSSTLLVSPMQKHDLIKDIGEAAGEEMGIPFYYHDFRPGYREGVRISREEQMYRQQYCGCIYSERDRHLPLKKAGKNQELKKQ